MNQNMMPYASLRFLNTRQQVISLRPTAFPSAGYVWGRILLKGGREKVR
ncbi:MAG: hypothetical protein ABII00_01930 [Elusimicrobiota bacterium]